MSKFEGTVEEIIFRNEQNGWTVAAVRLDGSGRTSAVGVMPFLAAGEHAIFDGELVEHREYGEQIRVQSYETTRPETKSSVEKYLASGLIRGVGPATAKLIVKRFGARALDVLESEPERLTEIEGIGRKRAKMIAESFAEQNATRTTLLFLQGYGISPALSMKIYRTYGDMTERVLRANPYRLVDEIDGVGFRTADGIAQSLGFSRESEFRIRSGIRYALSEAVNGAGHTYLPFDELCPRAARVLGADEETVAHALRGLILDGTLVAEDFDGERAVYLPQLHDAERDVARRLLRQRNSISPSGLSGAELEARISDYERGAGVSLCGAQREAVRSAAQEGIAVITGGPGTGKTTSINCVIQLLGRLGSVELCAPTGRAARRMSEATGRPARTIHRLLEYGGEGQGFARNEDNPLDANAVIVDEMSMVDSLLFASLLDALKPETYLILIGDVDQLPPVGAGNVLADMIESGRFGVVRLEKIFRQAQESLIITNAHRINAGELPALDVKDNDFFFLRTAAVPQTRELIVSLCRDRLPRSYGVSPEDDIQVITPTRKGELGTFELNRLLQAALNPPDPGKREKKYGAVVFREGDKIMQTRNNYDVEWRKDGTQGSGVFNGDMGRILKIAPGGDRMTLSFDGRIAEYDASLLEDVEHAYAITVHKSQGSEYPMVIIPTMACPYPLMTRNLLYTAVTRAKDMVILTGSRDCVQTMVRNNRKALRYTHLKHMLAR